jgi:tRNA nucleotidyltransferase (CCA-adding enzyme)
MKIYLVGGAVRDELLGLPVAERDWVVVGATAEQMLALGYRPVDVSFPVYLHPDTGEEYALARTERKTGPGYKGFQVETGAQVTLEQDLKRRDLTINALARDESGNLIDYFNGREDLNDGLLRHITPAFSEDPVRLLRVGRFAAKLGRWGFRVAHTTHGLMKKMADSSDLAHLKAERVWREMWRALGEAQPWRFFEVLHRCGALSHLMPEVDRSMGAQRGHAAQSDLGQVILKRAVELSGEPVVRAAAALYPAARQVAALDSWLQSLRAGREESLLLKDLLTSEGRLPSADDASALLRFVGRQKPSQQPQRFERFLLAASALWPDEMPALTASLKLAVQTLQCKPPEAFYRQNLSGADLGLALQAWREERLTHLLNLPGEKVGRSGS